MGKDKKTCKEEFEKQLGELITQYLNSDWLKFHEIAELLAKELLDMIPPD